MTHSFNLHDCAQKRLESDALAAQVAEHLANGGTLKTVPGYAPKPRPVSYMSKNVQQHINKEQANRNSVLQAIINGYSTASEIRAAVCLSHAATAHHLACLMASRKVKVLRQGNKRIWVLECAA